MGSDDRGPGLQALEWKVVINAPLNVEQGDTSPVEEGYWRAATARENNFWLHGVGEHAIPSVAPSRPNPGSAGYPFVKATRSAVVSDMIPPRLL